MTVGYPDFIRESKQAGTLIDSGTLPLGTDSIGNISYAGDYAYIIITVDTTATTSLVGCSVAFGTSPAFTTTMGQTTAAVYNGMKDSMVFRVRGPWIEPIFFWWDVATTQPITYYVYGTNMAPLPSIGIITLGQWASFNAAILAGNTATISPIAWHSGTARVTMQSNVASTVVLSIDRYQFGVGWQDYYNLEVGATASRSVSDDVPIPPNPIRMRLVNQGTGTATAILMAAPRDLAVV